MPFERSDIEKHPRFADILHAFERMRMTGKGINYANLHRQIHSFAPEISYAIIWRYFHRYGDTVKARDSVTRSLLRDRKKKIADKALRQVEENPALLSLRDRIRLAKEATGEELQEIGMVLQDRATKKQQDIMEKLVDDARYGDVIDVPDGDTGSNPTSAQLPEVTEEHGLPEPREDTEAPA